MKMILITNNKDLKDISSNIIMQINDQLKSIQPLYLIKLRSNLQQRDIVSNTIVENQNIIYIELYKESIKLIEDFLKESNAVLLDIFKNQFKFISVAKNVLETIKKEY